MTAGYKVILNFFIMVTIIIDNIITVTIDNFIILSCNTTSQCKKTQNNILHWSSIVTKLPPHKYSSSLGWHRASLAKLSPQADLINVHRTAAEIIIPINSIVCGIFSICSVTPFCHLQLPGSYIQWSVGCHHWPLLDTGDSPSSCSLFQLSMITSHSSMFINSKVIIYHHFLQNHFLS